MGTNGKPAGDRVRLAGARRAATLAADLNALVDRLEVDWRSRRLLDQETVEQVRDLRFRAEGLFGGIA
jgi:hypothetical protein